MLKKSTLLHLRIPFSIFLMPVYLFALALSPAPQPWEALLVFFILHLLVYPASNGYNSYYDRDTGPIGGLEHPPQVSRELYFVSLALDGVALLLALLVSPLFALGVLIYGTISKAYSHPLIRLKRHPVTSWLTAGFFQGAFTFWVVYLGLNEAHPANLLEPQVLWPGLITTLMLLGFYPLTQVYQHEEDATRGDRTISLLLGIRGTFAFSAALFALADAAFFYYFSLRDDLWPFLVLQGFFLPVISYFIFWMLQVWRNPDAANFRQTMRMNLIGSLALSGFFVVLFFW